MTQSDNGQSNEYRYFIALGFILIGVVFLLGNLDVIQIGHRWWALFFLIPIFYLLSDMVHRRKDNEGKFPPQARGSLVGLVTLVAVMMMFLLDLDWGTYWPVFIVIGGLAMLLSR